MSAFPPPDPSAIGGVDKAPFVVLPDAGMFERRANRLDALAADPALAPYLRLLAELCRVQATVAGSLPPARPISDMQTARAQEHAMPPLDRAAFANDPGLDGTLRAVLDAAAPIDMPPQAAVALNRVRAADAATLATLVGNLCADAIPFDDLAGHLFVAAGTQVHAARLAATLDAARLVPVGTGLCPVCGGPPVASLVVGRPGAEGARYAACSFCGTQWNEVRIKCLACGSTKGVGYRAVETGTADATVKAEVCDECHGWLKIMYADRNPSLDPVADDVASLGLDLLMRDTAYRRAGFNPFMIGT